MVGPSHHKTTFCSRLQVPYLRGDTEGLLLGCIARSYIKKRNFPDVQIFNPKHSRGNGRRISDWGQYGPQSQVPGQSRLRRNPYLSPHPPKKTLPPLSFCFRNRKGVGQLETAVSESPNVTSSFALDLLNLKWTVRNFNNQEDILKSSPASGVGW